MTLRQFVADAVELIDWLTGRFGQEKVYLLGHSWGSLLGATLAAEQPEKLHAYVGVGQLVAGLRNEQTSYAFTLRKAVERGETEAVDALRAIEGRYAAGGGLTFADLVVQRGWLDRFGGTVHGDLGAVFERVPVALRQEYFGELSDVAQQFSFGFLMPEVLAADLHRTARTFDVPVNFFIGRHDQTTPAELAVEYFEAIEAPAKQLHWFERSGHLVPFEEPVRFNALLIDCLRPTSRGR
jgi:proline iminopeptidase